ncbi:MAG TPA: AAA family ATPase, partial [Ktedonobacterales bacterium]
MGSGEGELFGDLLRRYRLALGWSQEELAWRAGVHVHTITNLERGQTRAPHRANAIALAKALELDDKARDDLLAARDRLAGRTHPPKTAYGTPRPIQLNVPPLKGRDDEHAQIRDLLVKNGPPVLALSGESGVGKSRLLIDAAAQGEQYGWIVMRGEAHRDEGQHPFAPIYQALHRHLITLTPTQREQTLKPSAPMLGLFPDLVRPGSSHAQTWQPTPDQERRLMFNSVAQYFAHLADSNGVLLILDDLQWAQPDAL